MLPKHSRTKVSYFRFSNIRLMIKCSSQCTLYFFLDKYKSYINIGMIENEKKTLVQ